MTMVIWGFLPSLFAIIGHLSPFFGLWGGAYFGDLSYPLNVVHFLLLSSILPIGNLDEFGGLATRLVAVVVVLHFKQKPVDCLRPAWFMRREGGA